MNMLKRTLPILLVLVVWAIFSNFSNPLFLPRPVDVLANGIILLKNGMLWSSIEVSFLRITVATLLSATVSIPVGLLVANYKFLDNLITPITGFMRFMPVTVFYPLLIMWVGIDETMKIAFLFCATFFFFLPTVILCIKDVNPDLVDTAKTMGMSKSNIMFRVLLPASLPAICQSFLMMYGIGWTYVIVAEDINTNVGLGHLINVSSARGRTDLVFLAMITILVISYVFDTIGNLLIKKIFKWKFVKNNF